MKKRKLKKEDLDKMGDLNLDKVLDEISKIDSREGIKTIAALLLNELMKKEREIYLRESIDNKANGYYERQLACFLGNLGISVPRDRKSEFRPAILPSEWQKADESFQEFYS
jgi:putative transposase